MDRPPPVPVPARLLLEGRYELRVAGCLPVVLTADTYFARTAYQHWQIARVLQVYARYVRVPPGAGRFREAGSEFVYEPPPSQPESLAFRVPRRIVISGEASGPEN